MRDRAAVREVVKAKAAGQKRFTVYMDWVPEQLPDELLDWPELEELELQLYSGSLAGLARLPRLRKVALKGGSVSGDLAAAEQVEEVFVEHGLATAFPGLEGLARIKRLRVMAYTCLETFPDLSRLGALESLAITAHGVSEVPESIAGARALRRVSLDLRGVDRVPDALFELPALEELDLRLDLAFQLGPAVGRARGLEALRVGIGRIGSAEDGPPLELPDALGSVPLRRLTIDRRLDRFPPILLELSALEELGLSLLGDPELPDAIGRLQALRVLNLRKSGVARLPDGLAACRALEALRLAFTPIEVLPDWVLALPALRELDLSYTRIRALPEIALGSRLRSLEVNAPLEALPASVVQLAELEEIALSSTELTELPDALAELPKLRSVKLSFNRLLRPTPPVLERLTAKIEAYSNGWQTPERDDDEDDEDDEDDDEEEEGQVSWWIRGLRVDEDAVALDVEKVIHRDDYPDSERQAWTFDPATGELAFERVTDPATMQYDCGYHREHFANTLGAAASEDATRVTVPLHGGGGSCEVLLPGDPGCLESPVARVAMGHGYRGTDGIDLLAVSPDEVYLTVKTSWIETEYLLLRGWARGRVWRRVASRRDEVLGSLAYAEGSVLVAAYGKRGAVYRLDGDELVPAVAGVQAALLAVRGAETWFGGGYAGELRRLGPGGLEGWTLDFEAATTRPAPEPLPDDGETWASARLQEQGWLDPAPPGPEPLLDPRWTRAIAAFEQSGYVAALDALAGWEWPTALRLALVCGERAGRPEHALLSCEALIREHPLEAELHATRARLLAATGAPPAAVEAANQRASDLRDGQSLETFARTWMALNENFETVELRLIESVAVLPDCVPWIALLGAAQLRLGRPVEAEAQWARAAALEPVSEVAAELRAALDEARGADPTGSYRRLTPEFLRRYPETAVRAASALHRGDDRALVNTLTALLRRDPDRRSALAARGEALARLGEREVSARDLGRGAR